MDRREKVYLDPSVLCYLDQQNTSEKVQDTWALWNLLMQGKYEAYIPDGVMDELEVCSAEKLALLQSNLESVPHHLVFSDERTVELADRIVTLGILPQKQHADCKHIANAILSGCSIFVSWNIRIATAKVSRGIRALTLLEGYQDLAICLPSMLSGEDEEEDTIEEPLEEPVLSDRFDLEDIRKLRAYNSRRYLHMTRQEILADIHQGAERFRKRIEHLQTETVPKTS